MIESFSDIVSKMQYHLKHKDEGYPIPLMPKLNDSVGNILPYQYTVVSGMASSGKTSFVDQNYVLSVLLQRERLEDKPPIKIFYFSLKDTSIKKYQSLLCTYLKLVHNIRVDIPTLNNQPGRIYSIENEPVVLAAIDDAEIFFNEIIHEGSLEVITGISKPSAIYAKVSEYLEQFDPEDQDRPLVIVVVDSTDHLSPENDGYKTLSGSELDYKFDSYIHSLTKENGIHAVIITPAHGANSRFPKENEPCYRQLGLYGKNCTKGIILYNPIAENNSNYLRVVTDGEIYVSPTGLNTLRFWHIVRNVDGIESVSERILFLPGTGFMMEAPLQESIDSFNEVKARLFNTGLNPFFKNSSSSRSDEDTPEPDDNEPEAPKQLSLTDMVASATVADEDEV
jgi:hypothetical protein